MVRRAPPRQGEPFKLGFDEGFTGFMALDASLVDHGIQVALDQVGNQVLGHPIEYIKADNGSDPVVAVDKARQLVESDKIDAMLGPMFSPSNAAVTDYLARNGGIPSISFMGQPIDNMKTANKLSFIPSGFFSMSGYYLGKYADRGPRLQDVQHHRLRGHGLPADGGRLQEGVHRGWRQDPQ